MSTGRLLLARSRSYLRLPIWWVCFLSIASLGLTQAGINFSRYGGTVAPAIFLMFWVFMAAAYPSQAFRAWTSTRLPWVLPAVALFSVLWSTDPGHTLRVGLELLATIAAAVLAASWAAPGIMVSATLCAFLLSALVSVASSRQTTVGNAGNEALIGIFGSKNYMGYVAALLAMLALATVVDAKQPRLLRIVAFGSLLLGPALLLKARSADALIGCAVGLACMLTVLGLALFPTAQRALLIIAGLVITAMLAAILFSYRAELVDLALRLIGKNANLTGRTYLWDRALMLIKAHPLLGVGYEAFWVQGNPEAEALWSHFQIAGRGGFSFHNLYYEIMVQLGALGTVVWFAYIATVTMASIRAAVLRPSPAKAFFLGYVAFTLARISVEVELLGAFDFGPILFAAAWVYATAPTPEPRFVLRRVPVS